ncbi:transposase [Streptomyces calvus]
MKGGPKTGRSPVDRGRTGSKHHLITDATGIPPAATLTGGNRNDVTQLTPLLQAVPPVRGKRGRPRRRPDVVLGDLGYDHNKYRRLVRDPGVKQLTARRSTEHGSGLGIQRWVVKRAFAHLHWFRRLRIRGGGDTRRHPRSLPHPRARTHLLETSALTGKGTGRRCVRLPALP